jgi:hypothetical protein
MHKDDLVRRVFLDVTNDGAVLLRERGERRGACLAGFSTDRGVRHE